MPAEPLIEGCCISHALLQDSAKINLLPMLSQSSAVSIIADPDKDHHVLSSLLQGPERLFPSCFPLSHYKPNIGLKPNITPIEP